MARLLIWSVRALPVQVPTPSLEPSLTQELKPQAGLPRLRLLTSQSLLSLVYITQARQSCFVLLRHWVVLALSLALADRKSTMAARIAMIAMTTSSSIKVI